jgi:plasmid stabilization system protein ParE
LKLLYTRRAAEQIDETLDYLAARSPRGAARVRERILTIVTLLQLQPYAGHVTSRPGVRRLAVAPFPYVVDYRIAGEDLIVMRFRHGARRPTEPRS